MSRTKPPTALDALRRMRDDIASDRTDQFPVPGFHGFLVVEVGKVDPLFVQRLVQTAQENARRNPNALLTANADLVIAATRDVLVRGRVVDGEVRLQEDGALLHIDGSAKDEGEPSGWNAQLAEAFGVNDADSARKALIGIIPDAMKVNSLASDIMRWLQEGTPLIDEAFLGES